MNLPLAVPKPDIDRFVKVIKGEVVPETPPFAEFALDYEVTREISTRYLGSHWVEPADDKESQSEYLKNMIEVYWKLGYHFVRMPGGPDLTGKSRIAENTAELASADRVWPDEGIGPITSWQDFEAYPWPDPDKSDLWELEFVAEHLPEGMGLVVGSRIGLLETPLYNLFGYEGLSYMLYDDPELVSAVFKRCGETAYRFYQVVLGLPKLCGFFQGDDMGYKTGTLIAADHIRQHSLPWHKKAAALAHDNGLLYLLHSCGHLDEIMEDLIEDVKIDAKHSYEDEGNSVFDSKEKYGDRVAILGGVDLDKLCRLQEPDLRKYVRDILDACVPGGRFALGSGNTICNYVPVENYLIMLDEGLKYGG